MQTGKKSNAYWVKDSERLYIDACNMLNYPEIPMGGYFEKIIRPDDTVLDLGCGFGVASVCLAGRCRQVEAIDFSDKAVDYLNSWIKRLNIKNINTYCGSFPETKVPQCDVTVILYVYKLIRNLDIAKAVLDSTGREGLILCNHTQEDEGFHKDLADRLSVERAGHICRNGCYIKGLFEALGVKTECEQIAHEFGQPVDDLDDAAKFMCWQLHLDSGYIPKIREMASDYITQKNGRLYIPYARKSCILHYIK